MLTDSLCREVWWFVCFCLEGLGDNPSLTRRQDGSQADWPTVTDRVPTLSLIGLLENKVGRAPESPRISMCRRASGVFPTGAYIRDVASLWSLFAAG